MLRNPAAGRLLPYLGSGFAPDFLLWLKRGGRQLLGLVDPKDLARQWPGDKLALIDALAQRSLSMSMSMSMSLRVRGFVVRVTGPDQMALPPAQSRDAAALKAVNVLLQSEAGCISHISHISHIIHILNEALAEASMSQVTPPDPIL